MMLACVVLELAFCFVDGGGWDSWAGCPGFWGFSSFLSPVLGFVGSSCLTAKIGFDKARSPVTNPAHYAFFTTNASFAS